MDDKVNALLQAQEPAVQALAARAYQLAKDAVPGAVVTVDGGDIGVGTGPGYQQLLFVVTPRKNYVTLGIARGADLPDPAGLLEGRGRVHRHVKLRTLEELDAPQLRELVAAALARALP